MTRLRPRLLVECEPDSLPRWARRMIDMADQADMRKASLFTREGYMKYVVAQAMARKLVDGGILPEQIILSQPVPMLELPKVEDGTPRNRHERRRQAAITRRF